MFKEYERVRIKGKNIVGDIVDIYKSTDGITYYTVESDDESPVDDPNAWNDVRFPQIQCTEDQLEPV